MISEQSSFDSLTRVTAQVLNAPIAAVSVVQHECERFLAGIGIPAVLRHPAGIAAADGYGDYVVSAREPLVIHDAFEHGAFRDLRLAREFDWVAYAGIPLISPRGHAIGALAVADTGPRHWTDADLAVLTAMAVPVVNEIELRVVHTEQLRMTEELRHSAELFSSIVTASSDAIICIDEDHHILIFNAGAEKIFGYSENEILGKPLDLLLPEPARNVHRQEVARFGRENVVARFKSERRGISGRRKNGEVFPAESSITRIEVGGRRIYSAVLRDVSEREQYHAALVQRAGELALMQAEMDRLT